MFSDDFCFYTGYKIPKCRGLQQFFEAIQALPSVDTPQVFGLHPNADITWVSQSSLLSSLETRSASSFFVFYREIGRCRSIKFSPYFTYLFVSQLVLVNRKPSLTNFRRSQSNHMSTDYTWMWLFRARLLDVDILTKRKKDTSIVWQLSCSVFFFTERSNVRRELLENCCTWRIIL